jgi:hypothetical protein
MKADNHKTTLHETSIKKGNVIMTINMKKKVMKRRLNSPQEEYELFWGRAMTSI